MSLRYIELDDISHLNQATRDLKNNEHRSKLWRESYYFNMTDPTSGLSLITTIGILPNRNLITGFVLVFKDYKILKLKPLFNRKRQGYNDYSFDINGLEYIIEGPKWVLKFRSKDLEFELRFEPINKIYPYVTQDSDIILNSIGSQHYEQFGIYKGEFVINKNRVEIDPCFGHRDHSWGIRDWSVMDRYRLFCCAFSKEFAFNLWEGWISNSDMKFVKGYIFDGNQNIKLVESKVTTNYQNKDRNPIKAEISVLDEWGKKYDFTSNVKVSIPVPPRQSIIYESLAEIQCKGTRSYPTGHGLLEYLFHEPYIFSRCWVFFKLFRYL